MLGIEAEEVEPAALITAILKAPGRPALVRRHRHLHQGAAARAMPRSAIPATTRSGSTPPSCAPRRSARAPISPSPRPAASSSRSTAAGSTPTSSTIRPASIARTMRSTSRSRSTARWPKAGSSFEERNLLLAEMTDEVAALVLEDNRLQTLALSIAERGGARALPQLVRVIEILEESGRLNRAVEGLDGNEELLRRAQAESRPHPARAGGPAVDREDARCRRRSRWRKFTDDPTLEPELLAAFPPQMQRAPRRRDPRSIACGARSSPPRSPTASSTGSASSRPSR